MVVARIKITLKRYLSVSLLALLVALVIQMSMKQDCAWDGCVPTVHPTIAGIFFGLPVIVLQVEIVLGFVLWVWAVKRRQ